MKKITSIILTFFLITIISACSIESLQERNTFSISDREDVNGNKYSVVFINRNEEKEFNEYEMKASEAEGFIFKGWYADSERNTLVSKENPFTIKTAFDVAPIELFPLFITEESVDQDENDQENDRNETPSQDKNEDVEETNKNEDVEETDEDEDVEETNEIEDEEVNSEYLYFWYKNNLIKELQNDTPFQGDMDDILKELKLLIEEIEEDEIKEIEWFTIYNEKLTRDIELKGNNQLNPEISFESDKTTYTIKMNFNNGDPMIEKEIPFGEKLADQNWFRVLVTTKPATWTGFEGWSTRGIGRPVDVLHNEVDEKYDGQTLHAIFTTSLRIGQGNSSPILTFENIQERTSLQDNEIKLPVLNNTDTHTFLGFSKRQGAIIPDVDETTKIEEGYQTWHPVFIENRVASEDFELTFNFHDQDGNIIKTAFGREQYTLAHSFISFPELELSEYQTVQNWYYIREGKKQLITPYNSVVNSRDRVINIYPQIDKERIEITLKTEGSEKTLYFPRGEDFVSSAFSLPEHKDGQIIIWENKHGERITPSTILLSEQTLYARKLLETEKITLKFEVENRNVEVKVMKNTSLLDNFMLLPTIQLESEDYFLKGWVNSEGEAVSFDQNIEKDQTLYPVIEKVPDGKHRLNFQNKFFIVIEKGLFHDNYNGELPITQSETPENKNYWVYFIQTGGFPEIIRIDEHFVVTRNANFKVITSRNTVNLKLKDYNGDNYKNIYIEKGTQYPFKGFLPALENVSGNVHLGWYDSEDFDNGKRYNQVRDLEQNLTLYPLYKTENKNSGSNYIYNLTRAQSFNHFGGRSYIIWQDRTAGFKESGGTSASYGCGWIATYNVLRYFQNTGEFNEEINIADIIRFYENDYEFMNTGGKNPSGIVDYLNSLGFSANHRLTVSDNAIKNSEVAIILNLEYVLHGHYRMVEIDRKNNDLLTMYNPRTYVGESWSDLKNDYAASLFTMISINIK